MLLSENDPENLKGCELFYTKSNKNQNSFKKSKLRYLVLLNLIWSFKFAIVNFSFILSVKFVLLKVKYTTIGYKNLSDCSNMIRAYGKGLWSICQYIVTH